jgi:hypothetical protein
MQPYTIDISEVKFIKTSHSFGIQKRGIRKQSFQYLGLKSAGHSFGINDCNIKKQRFRYSVGKLPSTAFEYKFQTLKTRNMPSS